MDPCDAVRNRQSQADAAGLSISRAGHTVERAKDVAQLRHRNSGSVVADPDDCGVSMFGVSALKEYVNPRPRCRVTNTVADQILHRAAQEVDVHVRVTLLGTLEIHATPSFLRFPLCVGDDLRDELPNIRS